MKAKCFLFTTRQIDVLYFVLNERTELSIYGSWSNGARSKISSISRSRIFPGDTRQTGTNNAPSEEEENPSKKKWMRRVMYWSLRGSCVQSDGKLLPKSDFSIYTNWCARPKSTPTEGPFSAMIRDYRSGHRKWASRYSKTEKLFWQADGGGLTLTLLRKWTCCSKGPPPVGGWRCWSAAKFFNRRSQSGDVFLLGSGELKFK